MRLFSSAWALPLGSAASKSLGLVREIATAAWFGTGDVATAWRASLTAFLLPIHAILSEVLSAGFVPVYRRAVADEGEQSAFDVLSAVLLLSLLVSFVISIVSFSYAEEILSFTAPGLNREARALSEATLRILCVAGPIYACSTLLANLESAHGLYGGLGYRPIFLNVGLISGTALSHFFSPWPWFPLSVVVGHLIILCRGLITTRRLGIEVAGVLSRLPQRIQGAMKFIRQSYPLLLLPLAAQSAVLIERRYATLSGPIDLAALEYARFVSDTVQQLIAVPVGVLILSKAATRVEAIDTGSQLHPSKTVSAAFLGSLVAVFVICAPIICEPEYIAALIFKRGSFDAASAATTGYYLLWYSLASLAAVPAYVLTRALSAELKNLSAMLVTVLGAIVFSMVIFLLFAELRSLAIGLAAVAAAAIQLLAAAWLMKIFVKVLLTSCIYLSALYAIKLVIASLGATGGLAVLAALAISGSVAIVACYYSVSLRQIVFYGNRPRRP